MLCTDFNFIYIKRSPDPGFTAQNPGSTPKTGCTAPILGLNPPYHLNPRLGITAQVGLKAVYADLQAVVQID